jgi:hypothetical protein
MAAPTSQVQISFVEETVNWVFANQTVTVAPLSDPGGYRQ